ncbi:MAG: hypothetical protein PUA71_00720 [Eubacteriales bacterium]|nr:hypothetical protein [Eubacteriales bacterium]
MKQKANSKNSTSIKRCTFCTNWYDPANSAIEPASCRDLWLYEPEVKKMCLARRVETYGRSSYNKFQCNL